MGQPLPGLLQERLGRTDHYRPIGHPATVEDGSQRRAQPLRPVSRSGAGQLGNLGHAGLASVRLDMAVDKGGDLVEGLRRLVDERGEALEDVRRSGEGPQGGWSWCRRTG